MVDHFRRGGLASLDGAAHCEGLWATWVGEEENALLQIDLQGHAVRVWRPRKVRLGWLFRGGMADRWRCSSAAEMPVFGVAESHSRPWNERRPLLALAKLPVAFQNVAL